MTADIQKIIEICRLDAATPSSVELSSLSHLAIEHGVGGWLYHRFGCNALRSHAMQTMADYTRKVAIAQKILDTFASEGLNTYIIKGLHLATNVYPEPWARPTGDVDMLTTTTDLAKAHRLLNTLAAKPNKYAYRTPVIYRSFMSHLPAISIDRVCVEMHYNLHGADTHYNPLYPTPYDTPTLLFHLTTHFLRNKHLAGNRLGWLLDIALLAHQNVASLQSIVCQAKKLRPSLSADIDDVLSHALYLLPQNEQQSCGLTIARLTPQYLLPKRRNPLYTFLYRTRRILHFFALANHYITKEDNTKSYIVKIKNVILDFKDFVLYRHR